MNGGVVPLMKCAMASDCHQLSHELMIGALTAQGGWLLREGELKIVRYFQLFIDVKQTFQLTSYCNLTDRL